MTHIQLNPGSVLYQHRSRRREGERTEDELVVDSYLLLRTLLVCHPTFQDDDL